MTKKNKKIIATLILISSGTLLLQAQTTGLLKYELGINAGAYIYQGDLTPNPLGSYKTKKIGLGFTGAKILNSSFSARGSLLFAKLKADESKYSNPEYRQQRNLNFKSPLIELTGQLVWNPLGRNYTDKGFSPYIFGGGGFSYLKVKRDWSNLNAEYFGATSTTITGLATDQQTTPPRIIPVLPVGLGARYNLSSRFAVTAESSYRVTFTDYIDGFSYAANPERNDHYISHTIGLVYRIGKKNTLGCPVVR